MDIDARNHLCLHCHVQVTPGAMFPKATQEITSVILEGEKTHPKNSWRFDANNDCPTASQTLSAMWENINHAADHLKSIERADDVENISHAATRCLMALQLLLELKEGNDDAGGV